MKNEIFKYAIALAQKAKARYITFDMDNGEIYLLLNSGYGFYFARGKWEAREAITPEDVAPDELKAAIAEAEKEITAYALKNKYITAEEVDLPF